MFVCAMQSRRKKKMLRMHKTFHSEDENPPRHAVCDVPAKVEKRE